MVVISNTPMGAMFRDMLREDDAVCLWTVLEKPKSPCWGSRRFFACDPAYLPRVGTYQLVEPAVQGVDRLHRL